MEPDNMLKEASNQQQTSVFGFEAYPGGNIYSLCPANSLPPNYNINTCLQFSNPMFANFIPTKTILSHVVNPEVPSSFYFGNADTPIGYNPFTNHSLMCDVQGNVLSEEKIMLGKRKTNSPPLQPCKQLITEEKMAEHMSRLHISSETVTSIIEPESVKNKRLYMCEEMRKLQADPIIPASIIPGVHQPCTALVLWQPPPTKKLPVLGEPTSPKDESEDEPTSHSDIQPTEIIGIHTDLIGGDMDLDS